MGGDWAEAFVRNNESTALAHMLTIFDGRYHSVRIDPVHFCQREIDLAEKRKRKSFLNRNGEPKDAPTERLKLLSRTVRENQYLAAQILFFKLPYMTRESCKADLARAVSAMPNLRYVDLPEGVYVDEPGSCTLKAELQSRCPDIRQMKYAAGAERSFAKLSQTRIWQNLEILELSHLAIEPSTLIYALASFPIIHELKLDGLPLLDDSAFRPNPQRLCIPPLTKFTVEDAPNVTTEGIMMYLSRPENREILADLTLINTGVYLESLHKVFAATPYLQTVHITETVSRALPPSSIPQLASPSIKSLHYEIMNPSSNSRIPHTLRAPAESYYDYLASSLLQGALPALDELFVLCTSIPDLLLPPPTAPFAQNVTKSPRGGLARPLRLYTKAIVEMEWQFTYISPPTATNRRGSATKTRPLSLYGNSHQLGPQWGERGRDSVMVGNGFGGFLAIPSEDALPSPAMHAKKKSKDHGWMG